MPRKKAEPDDDPSLPRSVNPQAINEELGILRTVEKETHAEKVLSLVKVKTEPVFDAQMDIWDVRTDKNRYWVITNPPGLYTQAQFPSADYALTFHVGLTYRAASTRRAEAAEQEQDQMAVPWRQWEHTVIALDRAEAAEEFQAVGILCRECLLSVVKAIVKDDTVPVGQDRPKLADFVGWSEKIAASIAGGPGDEAARAYLSNISKAAWQFVSWLVQAPDATAADGRIAIQAVESTLMAYGAAILRHHDRREP